MLLLLNLPRLAIYSLMELIIFLIALQITPRLGNSLGGTPLIVELPVINWTKADNIECFFDGKGAQEVAVLSSSKVICVSPFLQKTHHFVKFEVKVNGTTYEAQFLSCKSRY